MTIEALSERGRPILSMIEKALAGAEHIASVERSDGALTVEIAEADAVVTEEDRTRAASVFSALRAIVDHFHCEEDNDLALYGAFGYDIALQFDPIKQKLPRDPGQRDLALFFPDEILVVDNHSAKAWIDRYEFSEGELTTDGLDGTVAPHPFRKSETIPPRGDHEPGEYAKLVEKAKQSFARGDLFEVVPGQIFHERCESAPSAIARRLKETNPRALFLLHEPDPQRVPHRRVARDVRAGDRTSDRDLPDFGHDQARRRRDIGFRADPEAAQLQEGRVGTHHVLRCRPQRQISRLRARYGTRHRPQADRDVFAADPYR